MLRHVTTNDERIPKLASQYIQTEGRKVRYPKGNSCTKPWISLLVAAASVTDGEDKDGV